MPNPPLHANLFVQQPALSGTQSEVEADTANFRSDDRVQQMTARGKPRQKRVPRASITATEEAACATEPMKAPCVRHESSPVGCSIPAPWFSTTGTARSTGILMSRRGRPLCLPAREGKPLILSPYPKWAIIRIVFCVTLSGEVEAVDARWRTRNAIYRQGSVSHSRCQRRLL